MAQTHTFAYLKNLPLAGTNITPSGGSALSTSRVVGPITEENSHRVNMEDINESGRKVGSYHDDLERTIKFKLRIPTSFTVPALNSVLTIASASTLTNRYNGTWKISGIGLAFTADDATEVDVTCVQDEFITYA